MRTETRHSVVLLVGTGCTAALGLAYSVCAGRILGTAEYGVFTTVVSLVFWCHLALGPINGTVARFSAEYAGQGHFGKIRTLAREVARRVGAVGFIGLVVGVALLRPLADLWHFQSTMPLLVALVMIYLTLLLSVARGVLRGVQSFSRYNVNTIAEAATRLIVGLTLLRFVWGATSGLTAYVIALAVVLALSQVQLRRLWHGCAAEPLDGQAVRRFTLPLFVMMFASAGFQNIDMFIVKHCFAETEAGVYGAAFTWTRALGTLVTPFTTLMLPLLTTLHARGHALGGTFLRICSYFLLLAAVPLVVFWLWPEWLISWSYREDYAAAASLLLVLGAARLLSYLGHLIALAGAATNRFNFLYVYFPGLILEAGGLALWHDSLATVVVVVLAAQGVTLASLMALAAPRLIGARGRP